jgi:ribonuclease G
MGYVGVSRRIEEPDERSRLRDLVTDLRRSEVGYIVRTAGLGSTRADLDADMRYLDRLWEEVLRRSHVAPPGTLLHAEFDPVRRILRDLYSDDFARIVVDDRLTYQQCVDFLETIHPGSATRVELYTGDLPIFDHHEIQGELDRALRGRVWLRSGGFIVINQTEALVAIDVNTGKYVGRRRLEETVLRTNLEAVSEVVRQIRLRDLAGIIVVDFIDMQEEDSKRQVLETLESEMRRDRARTKLLQISDFGLVEITRQRARRSLERTLCRPCSYCAGSGRTRTPETVLFEIQREIQRIGPHLEGNRLVIRVHPELADAIEERRHRFLHVLPAGRHFDLVLERDPTAHEEEFAVLNLPAET